MTLSEIFISSFIIGFSGALTPGPVLSVTIVESSRRGFLAGPLITLGHGLAELGWLVLLGSLPFLGADLYGLCVDLRGPRPDLDGGWDDGWGNPGNRCRGLKRGGWWTSFAGRGLHRRRCECLQSLLACMVGDGGDDLRCAGAEREFRYGRERGVFHRTYPLRSVLVLPSGLHDRLR